MNRWTRRMALLAAVALPLAACDDTDAVTASDEARVSLLLTDAPGDVAAAVVTISEIYFQSGNDDASPRVVVYGDDTDEIAITEDLLDFENDVFEIVSDELVPEGDYRQLRMVIPSAYIVVEGEDGTLDVYAGGDTSPTASEVWAHLSDEIRSAYDEADVDPAAGTLQMPSLAQTGLKANLLDGTLDLTGNDNVLLVDFDVSRSFGHQAGQSGRWVMNPHIDVRRIEGAATSVVVNVALAESSQLPEGVTLADFGVVLTDPADGDETLELVEEDGLFSAAFAPLIAVGEYTVRVKGPEGVEFTTDPAVPYTFDVAAGQETDVTITITTPTSS